MSTNSPVTDSDILASFNVDENVVTNNCAKLRCTFSNDFNGCDLEYVNEDCSSEESSICEALSLYDQALQSGGDQ